MNKLSKELQERIKEIEDNKVDYLENLNEFVALKEYLTFVKKVEKEIDLEYSEARFYFVKQYRKDLKQRIFGDEK